MKNPNITGIIQSINRLVEACLGSAAGMVLIFCMRNIDTPTKTGRRGVVSGRARSSHRKLLSMGIVPWTLGSHSYSFDDSPTRLSGVDGRVLRTAW